MDRKFFSAFLRDQTEDTVRSLLKRVNVKRKNKNNKSKHKKANKIKYKCYEKLLCVSHCLITILINRKANKR